MTSEDREKLINETVRFVLTHYEGGPMPFAPTPRDPDKWWQEMQLCEIIPAHLLPRSREHFEARIRRWQELAQKEVAP